MHYLILIMVCYELHMSRMLILQYISFIQYYDAGFVPAYDKSIWCNSNDCVNRGGISFSCGKCLAQIVAIEKCWISAHSQTVSAAE